MKFDHIKLEPEQKELFIRIVEIMKQVPREDRGWMIEANSKDGTCLVMPRINSKQKNITGFAYGDLDIIAEAGLMKGEVTRSGGNRYVLRPVAYEYYDWLKKQDIVPSSNVVNNLNEIPIDGFNSKTKGVLREINRLANEIEGIDPSDEKQIENFHKKIRLEWNYHSNKLEGNKLTYGETRDLLYFDKTSGKSHQDHREIKGHDEAITYVEDLTKHKEQLSEKIIRELNLKVLKESYTKEAITPEGKPTPKKIIPGEYKSTPNHVKTKTGDIFKFAEPNEVPQKMEALIKWYRSATDLHPLIKAVELHYRFVNIHPFDDGNGRVARLLMNFSLAKDGFPSAVIKSEQKEEYHSALRQADVGDFEPLFTFIGNCLIDTLELYRSALKGEEINEYSDLDKRLKVFKMTLLQDEHDAIKEKRSVPLLKSRFEDSIWPLFEAFAKRMGDFYDLFTETELRYVVNDKTYSDQYKLQKVKTKFYEEALLEDDLRKLGLDFALYGFKKSGLAPLSTHIKVVVEFSDYLYEISTDNRNNPQLPSLKKLYHQKASNEEIENFIYKLASNLMDQVEQHYQNVTKDQNQDN